MGSYLADTGKYGHTVEVPLTQLSALEGGGSAASASFEFGGVYDPHSLGERDAGAALSALRRSKLAEIDQAEFSRFHVMVSLVAGVGFFTDAYDIFAIGMTATMLGFVYGTSTNCGSLAADGTSGTGTTLIGDIGVVSNGTSTDLNRCLTDNQQLAITVATPIGTLIGQLFFGWLADKVGRKRMYGVELLIIIVATFGQAVAGQGARGASIIGVITAWRVLMGVGIGGDYPLSAVISSEFSSTRIRGRLMTAVFANQGWGQLTASLVALIVVSGFKDQISRDTTYVDFTWRLLIGLGCVPGAIALYFRLTIPETPRFTMDVERNVRQAAEDVENFLTMGAYHVDPDAAILRARAPVASPEDFTAYFARRKNLRLLVGTAYSWFSLDLAFYGLGLNTPIILRAVGFGGNVPPNATPGDIYNALRSVAVGNVILSVAGLIPGYWAAFLVIDRWGRKPLQRMGFIMLTILFIIMGVIYDTVVFKDVSASGGTGTVASATKAFVFLYCLANFFQNFGPNTTTFIVPGEAFPTRYRATAHGISAASGKLGAIIAQVGFAKMRDIGGKPGAGAFLGHLLEILAFFMLTGVFSTGLLEETNQRSLEDVSNERQDDFVRGVAMPDIATKSGKPVHVVARTI